MRRGFTLIELLAVIVILAIIAIIATPIVLNIIKRTQASADQRSIEAYKTAIENTIAKQVLKDNIDISTIAGEYTTQENRTIINIDDEEKSFNIKYSGKEVVCETIIINNNGTAKLENCKVWNNNDTNIEYRELSLLPKEYKQVEYIESTGTQYINTELNGSSEFKVDIDIEILNTSSENFRIFGSRVGYGNQSFALFTANNNFPLVYFDVWKSVPLNFKVGNGRHLITMDKKIVYLDNDKKLDYSSDRRTFDDNGYPMYIFNANFADTVGTSTKCKLYSLKIEKNGILLRDYIPCYSTTTVIDVDGIEHPKLTVGLYDLINNQFYTNQGTGEFFVGSGDTFERYQQVEYLESTSTQYIKTGFLSIANTHVKANVCPLDDVKYYTAFGSNNSLHIGYYAGKFSIPGATQITKEKENFYSIDAFLDSSGIRGVIIDGTEVTGSKASKTGYEIYLFGLENSGSFYNGSGNASYEAKAFYGRLKDIVITQNDVKVRDFVPCYRKSDEKPGLYDMIENKFYTNDGTGEFTVGPDVN